MLYTANSLLHLPLELHQKAEEEEDEQSRRGLYDLPAEERPVHEQQQSRRWQQH